MRQDQVTEAEKLFSLDQPSLRALSFILRHKELWPRGFEWNFHNCETCAMGLAAELWNMQVIVTTGTPVAMMSMAFGMAQEDTSRIFCANLGNCDVPGTVYGVRLMSMVTPEMVADKIDEYLAGAK